MRHLSVTGGSSSNSATIEGPSTLPIKHKEALLTFVGIPTELPRLGPASLRTAYAKFKVLTNSSTKMQGLRSNKEWTEHLEDLGVEAWVPNFVDLVQIFIAKSQFYSGWKPNFQNAQSYPDMKAWLNDDSDCDSDSELWGTSKNADDYSFVDLASWLTKKDEVKAKKPAIASSSAGIKKEKRKKDKREVSESESESSEEQEKAKAKAKAKAKKGKKKSSE
jgi:hypothetical protein